MGFWILVPGVGMGGGDGGAAPTEGIAFSLGDDMQLEFSLPQLPEFSEPDDNPEFSL